MPHCYMAFGLCLESEIALPELIESDGVCDVSIRFGKADLGGEVRITGSFYKVTDDEVQFDKKDAGLITVRSGREIIIDPVPGVDEALLRFSIMSFALASILQHRGLLVFHASAVAVDGKAAMFLGWSGSGKSTIAAAMHAGGCRILSDEITAIQVKNDAPMVLSGLPSIRLIPESARYLGYDPNAMPLIRSDDDKRAYSAKGGFEDGSIPLQRIYIIENGNGNLISPLNPQEAFHQLVKNYYTAGILLRDMAPSHLKQCARVISTVPVKRLSRSDGLGHLPDLIDLVKADMDRPT
jgi:hypothetical protein